MKISSLPLLGSSLMMLSLQIATAAEPFDPLAKTATFAPSVTFSESHADSLFTEVDRSDPEAPFVTRTVVSSQSISATIVANITGIVLADLDETTHFSITLGNLNIGGTLGDDQTYTKGKTSIFIPAGGFDENNKPIGSQGARLSWTATKLTVTLTGSTASGMPGSVEMDNWNTVPDPNAAIRVISKVSVDFGTINGAERNLYIAGKSSVTHKRFGSEEAGTLEEFDLISVSLTGSCEYAAPSTTVKSPVKGASVGPSTTITGSASDGHGIEKVEYALNPADADPVWSPVTTTTFPVVDEGTVPPWGKTTVSWTIALNNLPKGTSTIWIRCRDISENLSPVAVTTVVNPIAPALQSRWDGLLVPTELNPIRGALTLSVFANGGFTGKLMLENGPISLSGTMKQDGTLRQVIKRLGQPDLTLTGDLLGAETNPGGLVIAGTLHNAAGEGAAFQLFRSPYSAIAQASASLAGRFHVKIDPPASPVMGYSFVIATTNRAGVATATLRMADGQSATWSGVLGVDGQLPVFVPLYSTIYKTKGSVSSLLKVDSTNRTIPATTARWFRPLGASDAQFPPGYNLTLNASGAAYTTTLPPATRVMSLSAGAGNAVAKMQGEAVTGILTKTFTVNANNSTTPVLPNPNNLIIAAIPVSTGQGAGSFNLPGTTTSAAITFLIVGNEAFGYYIAPATPGNVNKRFGQVTLGSPAS